MGSVEHTPTTGVVVTGAGSGIGQACARALAEVGRPVACWDLDGDSARRTAEDLVADHDVVAVGLAVDVTDSAGMAAAADTCLEAMGSLGGLVNAAGIAPSGAVDLVDDEHWDRVLAVNLRGSAMAAKAVGRQLRATGPGSAIVNIASIEALVGSAVTPAYGASKAGVLGLTRSLAMQYAPRGIRVNAVCPGPVDTPMLAPVLEIEEFRAALEGRIPMARYARPSEVAAVVRFLLSDQASYVTGACLPVDGGYTAAS